MTVSALFVDVPGIYTELLGNGQCWGIARDARRYQGPGPVVAHPPCQLWTNMAHVNFKRYGGEHNRPGNDGGCFASAHASVLEHGGVLEHPAGSHAFKRYCIPVPPAMGWCDCGAGVWVCEVWQSAYGHKARKRTWLMYSGRTTPPELNWAREAGTHQIGWFDRIKPTLSKKEAKATPRLFAIELIRLAEHSRS